MANPLVPQGTLNRLRGSAVIPAFPQLNVTAAFLGKEAMRLTFGGVTTTSIQTMTGLVQSPEPYQPATLLMHLLKTQALANAWEGQRIFNALLGDVVVTTDSTTLTKYPLSNCALENVGEIDMTGGSADYAVTISGIYYINNLLWLQ